MYTHILKVETGKSNVIDIDIHILVVISV